MTWPITVSLLGVLAAVVAGLWLDQKRAIEKLREQYRQAHLELETGVTKTFADKVAALEGVTASLKSRVENLMANKR